MIQFKHSTRRAEKGFSFTSIAIALLLSSITLLNTASAQEWVYTVRPGDSLWEISNNYLISPEYWPKVQALNGVKKTRRLKPGTRLTIPVEWLKQQPATASIINSRGQVELIRKGKTDQLPPDNILHLGDRIRTGKNSSINIQFSDGSQLLVLPKSEIYLETLERQKDRGLSRTAIKLINGRIENKVIPQNRGSRYQINTPAAFAAVRGTEFRIGVDDGGDIMRSEVLTGSIGVTGSGVTQSVGAGYATIAKVGSPPIAPRQLLAAPDLSGLGKHTTANNITYQWPPLAKSSNYRAELAFDGDFSQLIASYFLDTPQVTWTALIPSTYFMRVRAIDELGLEGFDAQHTFTINKPLQAPTAFTPRNGIILSNNQPFIAWSNITEANAYLLQLASDQAFSKNLESFSGLTRNNFEPVNVLSQGEYYWRVQSISRHGDKSIFSAPRVFTIKPGNE